MASWLSPRGAYLYCLGEDGNVFCFETIGKLESVLQVGCSTVCPTLQDRDHILRLDSGCNTRNLLSGSIEQCSQQL